MTRSTSVLKYSVVVITVTLVIALSVLVPSELARLQDQSVLDTVRKADVDNLPESFRYSLTASERMYILSMALNNRNILQSDYAAALREKAIRTNRDDTTVSFAYVENKRGKASDEVDAELAMQICESELAALLKEGLEIEGFQITNPCRQTLYSAVDMLEPQKNVSVWQLEYDGAKPPVDKPFSLMEAYIDAETGALYGFSFRMKDQVDFETDALAKAWISRLSIADFGDITENNPLTETASRYKKFATEGMDNQKTVFTVGFYEGVNEVFVRIMN